MEKTGAGQIDDPLPGKSEKPGKQKIRSKYSRCLLQHKYYRKNYRKG